MRILVAGDFYPSERVKTLIEKKEYETILGEVTSIVKSVDYAIVNYESPVVLGKYKPILKCGPNLLQLKMEWRLLSGLVLIWQH